MIVLEIIGGIVVVILAIITTIYIYFRLKFGRCLGVNPGSMEPLIVHLNEDISPTWLEEKKAKDLLEELESLGYIKGNAYSIYELDGCSLLHLHQGCYAAVLYSHAIAGNWVDILIEDSNGKQFTFANAPMGGGLDERPDSEKTFLPGAELSELHKLAQDMVNVGQSGFNELPVKNFREYFEESYKKDMAWRNRKGGVSFEEFENIEKQAPFKTKKKHVIEAYKDTKLVELNQWHYAALENYRQEKNIDEEKWYEIKYNYFIVPFKTHAHAFLEYLEDQSYLQDSEVEKLKEVNSTNADVPQLFLGINSRLSPELRAKLEAEMSFPLQLSIYKRSEKMSN